MTKEEKDLLLKDLSARLAYDVKVHIIDDDDCIMVCKLDNETINFVGSWDIKPYLRPMESMTKEERDELERICSLYACDRDCNEEYGIVILSDQTIYSENPFEALDWLNEHHFDYRRLIEKDLALEAPEWMYKN